MQALYKGLIDKGLTIALAESCTGGMIAAALTAIPGASAVFDRGFVTYSNQAKVEMLGVNKDTIDCYGAVSAETAQEMALGALKHSNADIALSVTGIAGPDGGCADKPAGLVYIGIATAGSINISEQRFAGDRASVRQKTVDKSVELLLASL